MFNWAKPRVGVENCSELSLNHLKMPRSHLEHQYLWGPTEGNVKQRLAKPTQKSASSDNLKGRLVQKTDKCSHEHWRGAHGAPSAGAPSLPASGSHRCTAERIWKPLGYTTGRYSRISFVRVSSPRSIWSASLPWRSWQVSPCPIRSRGCIWRRTLGKRLNILELEVCPFLRPQQQKGNRDLLNL